MGLDTKNDKDEIAKKIDSIGTACSFKKQSKQRKKKQRKKENKEIAGKERTAKEKIKQYKEKQKEKKENKSINERVEDFEEKAGNLFEDLIDIFKKSSSSPSDSQNTSNRVGSVDFLFKALYFATSKVKSQFPELLIEAILETLGCSENFSFENLTLSNTPFYIKVSNLDIFGILKYSPNDEFGKFNYEKNSTSNGTIPYSMNRELYNRLKSANSFSQEYGSNYVGASGNQLFDIKYTTTAFDPFGNPLPQDDYFEIKLNTLPNNGTTVVNFLNDYYSSIQVFDLDELIKNSLNKIFGFLKNALEFTVEQNEDIEKFFKILRRIMGLCSDQQKKIDVSGTAKLSDEDILGDGFFEITNQNLRNIQEKSNKIVSGVVNFNSCGEIDLPINNQLIASVLNDVITENKETKKIDKFLDGIKLISSDPNWQGNGIPFININLDILSELLGNIPIIVFETLLSPKVLLGLFVMFKAFTYSGASYINNLFENAKDFLQKFKKFAIPLCRKIIALFIKEVFNYIKSNIKKLVECLLVDIVNESKDGQLRMYTSIVYALIQVTQAVIDFRECKNVIDEIIKLLNLATSQLGLGLPSFILQGSQLLNGISQTRTLTKTLEALQEAGLPTGDNADGTPNLMNTMMDSLIKGMITEQQENGKTEIAFPPTPQFPKGFKLFGKSY